MSAVGLYVSIFSFARRTVRIVAEGRTRITVAVLYKNGRTFRTTIALDRVIAVPIATADALTKSLTAFGSFSEMLCAKGGYRPTIMPTTIAARLLRQAYDQAQVRRGDARRAYPAVAK